MEYRICYTASKVRESYSHSYLRQRHSRAKVATGGRCEYAPVTFPTRQIGQEHLLPQHVEDDLPQAKLCDRFEQSVGYSGSYSFTFSSTIPLNLFVFEKYAFLTRSGWNALDF